MRVRVAVLLALAFAPLAAGHEEGEHVPHIQPVVGTVAPAETVTRNLTFEEGPLREGWVFALVARQEGGAPLEVRVSSENDTEAARWDLASGETRRFTTLLPETGEYRIALRNPGDEPAQYMFYFDQSCNCVGKPVPKELQPGLVVFNTDADPGTRLRASFPQPRGVAIQVTASVLVGAGGSWPGDFRTLAVSTEPHMRRAAPDLPAVPIHELVITVPEQERVYFFVEPVSFGTVRGLDDLFVTPFYEEIESKDSPAPSLAWLALALLAAFALRRR